MATTAYEERARATKAYRLADVLTAHRSSASSAAALPDEGRTLVAELAGTRQPSEATWALVCEILAEREREAARLAAAWLRDEEMPDPLAGIAPVNVDALVS